MKDSIDDLAELFKRLPGIGERQAKRFVYFLIGSDPTFRKNMADKIVELSKEVTQCPDCFRYFQTDGQELCDICSDASRDEGTIMVVEKDADILPVERSDWNGKYFVFGALIPIAEEKIIARTRMHQLKTMLAKKRGSLTELVLGFPMTPAGDHTDQYVREEIVDLMNNTKLSSLGRGLSTGTELEYSDAETIKNALKNRA